MRANPFIRFFLLLALLPLTIVNGYCAETGPLESDLPDLIEIDSRDRAGLKRDTRYFLAYQWITIGLLYASPESVSGWSDEQKEGYDMSYWWDNVTHPEMDSDDFYINYLLHPYWGAAYFVRAAERGYSEKDAFWYSALLSTLYEFGAEALFEEPSIQDLIVTPTLGSLLGKYFVRVRGDIRRREEELGYRTRKDRWVWVLTDPLGSLNKQFAKLTGSEAYLEIRPYSYRVRPATLYPGAPAADGDIVYGFEVLLQW